MAFESNVICNFENIFHFATIGTCEFDFKNILKRSQIDFPPSKINLDIASNYFVFYNMNVMDQMVSTFQLSYDCVPSVKTMIGQSKYDCARYAVIKLPIFFPNRMFLLLFNLDWKERMSQTLKQLWKNSSSLIILGRSNDTKLNNFNYKVKEQQFPSNIWTRLTKMFCFPGFNFGTSIKIVVSRWDCVSRWRMRTSWSIWGLVEILQKVWCWWCQIQVNYQIMHEPFLHFQAKSRHN